MNQELLERVARLLGSLKPCQMTDRQFRETAQLLQDVYEARKQFGSLRPSEGDKVSEIVECARLESTKERP